MGRKKGGRKRALDFVVSIDPSGEVNLCKQGVGPGAWGAGKIDDRALLSVAEELVKYENKERVRVLDLSQNKISRLPDKMQRLHKLEVLVLDCNQIEALPHWLPELVSLRELWIQDNPIAPPLPRQLDEMVQLRRLVVDRPLEKEARQVLELTQNQRDAEYERVHGHPPPPEPGPTAAGGEDGAAAAGGGGGGGPSGGLRSRACVLM